MNNKIFIKIGWMFILGLLAYLFFVVFFLSPKVNNFLSETEINNSKMQFTKIESIINNKSRVIENKDKLIQEVNLILSNSNLGENSFTQGINSLILNTSMALLGVLLVIGLFIAVKIIMPINKMYAEVQKINKNKNNFDNEIKAKDEIGFLSNQFNRLLSQVKNNEETLDEHVQKTKEIQDRLYIDELTNLKNRTALEDDIKNNDFVSIALLDIDSFDDINELYGFSTGNLVLIEVAKILNKFSKKYNVTPYRFYGNVYCLADKKMMGFSMYDEFINELCKLFKNKAIHVDELSLDIYIDVTLGISIAQEEPIKTAGIALKKAKKTNKRYFVYNNEIDTKEVIKKSIYWREKIKTAIEENRVIPFYQAIFNSNNEIVKYETLMRIKDINTEAKTIYLSPNLFMDVAIKTKQYLQLSNQVISKALNDLLKTTKQVSLNLSFKDILDRDFVSSLDKNLDKIDDENKKRIVFEILESDYITDYSLLEEFIIKYRNQGIKIAIDDFGTGYSNFSHIMKIRPNYIKIDGSLIKNINTDKNSYELVKSIIDFSKALNIKVIAEFVHSAEVHNTVLDLGVDEFQGFYLAKPSLNIE